MDANQVGQWRRTPSLDVDDIFLLAVFFHDKSAKKPQWRPAIQRIACHQGKEMRIIRRFTYDQPTQLRHKIHLPTNSLQIEENITVKQGPGVGSLNPLCEIPFPDRQWLTPLAVGRHDIALAVTITTGIQTITDELCQIQKIVIVCVGIETIVEYQSIILIGHDQLLIASHGT